MSVLVKGMEMPTRCFACPMCDAENAEVSCAISHGSYIEYREVDPKVAIQERPSWCPISELPSHGRLIDADAFDERVRVAGGMCEEELTDDFKDGIQTSLYMLGNQPTVIPADKDGET